MTDRTEPAVPLTARQVMLDIDHLPVDLEGQVEQLLDNRGTDRQWCALGVADDNGLSEVIALLHESTGRIVELRWNAFHDLVAFVRAFHDMRGPAYVPPPVGDRNRTAYDDLHDKAGKLLTALKEHSA